ncbi:xylose isomerase [Veronia pacifica]|uniref:Xylose isomerase n=1 Tax=Veronia pacifica TaxID=1080227 RepID=A0A1C3EKZ7_9GAMM|nr:xylose isomerase [Veronia pacifica]ODA33895.1 xylose isomerase [Veronia pacifica]
MTDIFIGNQTYFPEITRKIPFEGIESDSPLAFKFYDEDKVIAGKTMKEHLRFSACYWHTFCGKGSDPFGPGTQNYPWDAVNDPMTAAKHKLDAAFEFFSKLGVPYYCFHDRDLAPEGTSPIDSENRLMELADMARERQNATGVRLLWGTANLFSHPRYMNGAATNPDFNVLAHAGSQVKSALDATIALDGENYVFWGGREGYTSLLNTRTDIEIENMARFLQAARDYGRACGFTGTFLIEPKPMEPMKHQYDFDAQTVIGFLRHHGLENDFKLNIEANHATLASHTFSHELQMSVDAGLLGSIDANRGDPQNGWDTDQFPTDIYDTTQAMMVLLSAGGFQSGGLNFDAKLRRESTDLEDMFVAHIGGMDAFARGLEVADYLLNKTDLKVRKTLRYSSFSHGKGADFQMGKLSLRQLFSHAESMGELKQTSGKQEYLENLINQALVRA